MCCGSYLNSHGPSDTIECVGSYKYLGAMLDERLK